MLVEAMTIIYSSCISKLFIIYADSHLVTIQHALLFNHLKGPQGLFTIKGYLFTIKYI